MAGETFDQVDACLQPEQAVKKQQVAMVHESRKGMTLLIMDGAFRPEAYQARANRPRNPS